MKGDFLTQIPLPGFFPLLLLEEMIAENRKKASGASFRQNHEAFETQIAFLLPHFCLPF